MFGASSNNSAVFQNMSNSSNTNNNSNVSVLFGQLDKQQSTQTSNQPNTFAPFPVQTKPKQSQSIKNQVAKQPAKGTINQIFLKEKNKQDAPKQQNIQSNVLLNNKTPAFPVQQKNLLSKPNNEKTQGTQNIQINKEMFNTVQPTRQEMPTHGKLNNNKNNSDTPKNQSNLISRQLKVSSAEKQKEHYAYSFVRSEQKNQAGEGSRMQGNFARQSTSSNSGIHSGSRQSGALVQGGNLNRRRIKQIRPQIDSYEGLVCNSVAIYQKLRNQQELEKEQLQIIQQNYSKVIKKQKDNQNIKSKQKQQMIVFFHKIIDPQEKEAMSRFWFDVMVKFEQEKRYISLDGVVQLTRQHAQANANKYIQNNGRNINRQLFESGAFYKQNNEIKINENSALIKSIISNLERLYFSYIWTTSMIIDRLTDDLQFLHQPFRQKMVFNCYQAFERVSSFNNQQINNIQVIATVKSLLRLYNLRGTCFSRIIIADFIRVVDQRYPQFAGKQEQRLTTELAVKMVARKEVIQQVQNILTSRQTRQREQPKQLQQARKVVNAIKNIKNPGLKPLYWLLFQLDQKLPKPSYFIIEGSHFKPLIDQLLGQLSNKATMPRILKEVIFRCVCSILKEKASEFWQNEVQFRAIIEFLSRQLTLDTIQSHRKLAKVMECAMGKAPYSNAYHVLTYFIPYFIADYQNDNCTIFSDVFLETVTGQSNLQIRQQSQMKDPYNVDTDHAIFSFLLKAVQGYPQAISMFSDYFFSRRMDNKQTDKKQIQMKICRALIRDYLLNLHQNQAQQMHQVFKALNALLQDQQTRSIALPIIDLSDPVRRRKGQQILSKLIRNPKNYYILAEHLSLLFVISEQMECEFWFNMINDVMNQSIQGMQMNQLTAYGKFANKYFEFILKKEAKSSKVNKEVKRGAKNRQKQFIFKVNENIIFMYFRYCFQMHEDSQDKYQNISLLRQQYQDLNQAVQLLKNILLIVSSPQLTGSISKALRQHIMLPNMNGRSQLELRDSRQTSYAAALILLLKNSQFKNIKSLQSKINPKFKADVIDTISLLFMANQAYLKENQSSYFQTQSADNFYILNIYQSYMQIRNTASEKGTQRVYKSVTYQLTVLIKTQAPGPCIQLLINIPFSIISFRDIQMLAIGLIGQQNPRKQSIFSMSRFLTFLVSRNKEQSSQQLIQLIKVSLEWLIQNSNRFLQNQKGNQQNITTTVENIMNAILVANVESTVIFIEIIKIALPLIMHPQNIKIQSKKSQLAKEIYNKGLLIIFSSKSFLTDSQFRQICQINDLKKTLIKFFEELAKHPNSELLGLFCLKFILDSRIYENQLTLLNVIKNIQSELFSGQNAIGYTVFISMYCQNVQLPQIQMFINSKLNQKNYLNPLFLCCNPEIIQDKNLTLRLAQATYQNYQMHPLLHAAACSYFLRQILLMKNQAQANYFEQSKEGTYLDILMSIQRTVKNRIPSRVVIWNTTFMFYLAAWDSTFIDRIHSILFDSHVLMQRLSYLMNKVKRTQWMGLNNYQGRQNTEQATKNQGLNLIEKTQLFCLIRCLSAVYNHHEKWNKTSKKFVDLCRSILRGTSTIAALFSSKISVDSEYQSELSSISIQRLRMQQSYIRQIQREKTTVLDAFHQHLNILISQAYIIMLRVVLSFPIDQQRLNQGASLELSNQILNYYVKFQKKVSSNMGVLEQIQQKYFKSVHHSTLLGYSNNFAVTPSLMEQPMLLKKTMQLSLLTCQKIGDAMSLSVHLPKFNKQFQKIFHRLRQADIRIDSQFESYFERFETRSSNRLTRFQSARMSDLS